MGDQQRHSHKTPNTNAITTSESNYNSTVRGTTKAIHMETQGQPTALPVLPNSNSAVTNTTKAVNNVEARRQSKTSLVSVDNNLTVGSMAKAMYMKATLQSTTLPVSPGSNSTFNWTDVDFSRKGNCGWHKCVWVRRVCCLFKRTLAHHFLTRAYTIVAFYL